MPAFSLQLSLQVAVAASGLTLVIGTMFAYLLARKDFRGKELVDVALTLPLVLPPVVTGYVLVVLLGRQSWLGSAFAAVTGEELAIMFSPMACVVAAFTVSFPLMVKTVRAAIESVDPEMVNTSYTLGRSEWHTALRVVLPLARPGIFAGLTLAFARALGEFGATMMLAGNIPGKTNTMPLEIYNKVAYGEWQEVIGAVVFFTAVSCLFLYLANRLGQRAAG